MDFVLVESILHFRAQGINDISLGGAPLANVNDEPAFLQAEDRGGPVYLRESWAGFTDTNRSLNSNANTVRTGAGAMSPIIAALIYRWWGRPW